MVKRPQVNIRWLGKARVWTAGRLAIMWRLDKQFGHLWVAHQWDHQEAATLVRPGLEKGERKMNRIVKPETAGVPIQEAEGGDWLELWPNLTEFFTATRFSNPVGPRKPGCLILTTRFKMWSAILKCPNDLVQIRCDAPTPQMLFTGLETMLVTPGTPWEPDTFAEEKKNGKRR